MAAVIEPDQQEPTDAELKCKIKALIVEVDVKELRVKQFVQLLSKRMGNVNLQPRKAFIKSTLADMINQTATAAAAAEDGDDNDDDENEEEDDEDDSSVEETAPPKKKGRGGGGGGLSAKKEISDALANFLGQGKEMARTDIVKLLWVYIRKHNLQNPQNKKEIILDQDMKNVFGCNMFTMFSMNKYIGAHVHPYKPVDLTSSSSSTTPKKRKAAASGGKGGSSKNSDGGIKKKRKAGTQPPFRLSDTLQDVVGEAVLPRPQVVKKIWEYIRANNLQNPNDKREILCDEKLRKVMGGKKSVTMFNMNTHISPHLIEKADKSEYKADNDDDDDDEE